MRPPSPPPPPTPLKPPPAPRRQPPPRSNGPIVSDDENTRIEQPDETTHTRAPVDPDAARTLAPDSDVWTAELTALTRNASQLSERDATRGALLFGAVSVLAATMQRVRHRV